MRLCLCCFGLQGVYIPLNHGGFSLNFSGFLLIAEDCDYSSQGQHLHAKIYIMDYDIEFVCEPPAEDHIVRVVDVHYIKSDNFVLALLWSPKDTGKDIFPKALTPPPQNP